MTSRGSLHPPSPTLQRRKVYPWLFLLLFILCVLTAAWRSFSYQRAVNRIRSAGFFISSPPSLSDHIRVDWKRIFDVEILQDQNTWDAPPSIEVDDVDKCSHLRNFDSIAEDLRRIQPKQIVLFDCNALENLDALKGLIRVKRLEIHRCAKLTNADGINGFISLEALRISGCPSVRSFELLTRLDRLTKLQELQLWNRPELKNADDLKNLSHLRVVEFKNCDSLENVDGLIDLPNLGWADFESCAKLSKRSVDALRLAHPNKAISGP